MTQPETDSPAQPESSEPAAISVATSRLTPCVAGATSGAGGGLGDDLGRRGATGTSATGSLASGPPGIASPSGSNGTRSSTPVLDSMTAAAAGTSLTVRRVTRP